MKSRLSIVLSACLLLTAIPALSEASPAYDFTSAPMGPIAIGETAYVVGFKFTANSNLNVSSLGFYDDAQNGLATSHEVGIFDASGNKLTSVVIPGASGADLVNKFRYASIPSLSLVSGASYTIAGATSALDGYNYGAYPAGTDIVGLSVDPSISILGGVFAEGSTLTYPTKTFNSYLYPTVNMNVAPVPVPAALPLLGIGLVGLGALRRKALSVKA
ncbi:MAG: DUF4082 domain-containing protein [Methylococcales bacterium]